jgi:hypothetical protein
MKKCKECKKVKDEFEFYGVQGECKECTKKRVRLRESSLRKNPDWVEKERARAIEKYVRLYRKSLKPYPVYKNGIISYEDKFPEKIAAKNLSQHIRTTNGEQKHHWSYCEEHYKDVIFLSHKDHVKLHKYLYYDQKKKKYRTLAGKLLNTKEKHLNYFEQIKNFD